MGSSLNVGVRLILQISIFDIISLIKKKSLTEMNMYIILMRMHSKLIVMIATAILTAIRKY